MGTTGTSVRMLLIVAVLAGPVVYAGAQTAPAHPRPVENAVTQEMVVGPSSATDLNAVLNAVDLLASGLTVVHQVLRPVVVTLVLAAVLSWVLGLLVAILSKSSSGPRIQTRSSSSEPPHPDAVMRKKGVKAKRKAPFAPGAP